MVTVLQMVRELCAKKEKPRHDSNWSIDLSIPPMSAMFFKCVEKLPEPKKKEKEKKKERKGN